MTAAEIDRTVGEILGDSPLRPGQREALEAALAGDVLAVLATGTGKSLVFQVAGRLIAGPSLVICPTIALQADQLAALEAAGDGAGVLNSTVSASRRRTLYDDLAAGRLEFLLSTPEQLQKPEVVDRLRSAGVSLAVVDEAHCVSSWGHDFRPDYLALAAVFEQLGRPRVVALTATASPRVRGDIVDALDMRDPVVVVGEVDRPEIWLGVRFTADEAAARDEVVEIVTQQHQPTGATIVYTATRKTAEKLAARLAEGGLSPRVYHGGLSARSRDEVHAEYRSGDADLIVATSAFGLGVDRPNVRLVVHADPPPNLDAYYQEVGRAGRDGECARGVLVTHPSAYGLPKYFSAGGVPAPDDLTAVLRAIGRGEGKAIRLRALGDLLQMSSSRVRRLVNALISVDAVRETRNGLRRGRQIGEKALVDQAIHHAEAHQLIAETGVELVRRYAETTDCRRRLILELLGEQALDACGNCDNCDAGTDQPLDNVPFRLGSAVTHPTYGLGTVQQYEGDRITVLFEEAGFKTLALDVVEERDLLTPEQPLG